MRKLLLLALLLPIVAESQTREVWGILNLTNTINQNWTVVTEAEERYTVDRWRTRYLHYDVGVQRRINDRFRVGAHYREIYEIKSEKRVMERRPHLDLFYLSSSKAYKVRTRLEYQFREHPILQDQWRMRVRPEKWWPKAKLQPYVQEEAFVTKADFTRSRTSAGITIGKGRKWQLLTGVVAEANKREGKWTWIIGPTLMAKGNQ